MKTDIEDIVSTYVTLRKRGSTFVGLCPFHNEKTPSFTVYPETQSFYCFGCGAGGDAVGFMKKIENLDYIDAVKALAQRAGMQMPEDGYDDSLGRKRRRILEINRAAARFFHSYMMSNAGKAGYNYFLNRGLTKKTIVKFGLGYAPDGWDVLLKHLKENGFSISEMLESGLITKTRRGSYIDMFRNRVMTPVIDIRGNVIAFGGRVLDDSKPKYINTSETLVYKKTNELFGMNLAKAAEDDSLILCEGYMDVIAMHQAGFTNAVAGCGTALTNEQVKLISRYADEVVLCYDNDEAGRKALNRAIEMFRRADIKIRIPNLSGGKDPDEIIRAQGRERFAAMLDGSANEIEYAILNLRNEYNLHTTQGKVDFLNEVIKLLSSASVIEQELYISRLSEELQIEKDSVMAQLSQYKKRQAYRTRRKRLEEERSSDMRELTRRSYESSASARKLKAEERMLAILIKYPKCIKLCTDFSAESISDVTVRKAFSIVTDLIDKGYDINLSDFSAQLNDKELSELSRLINLFDDSKEPEREFSDCINIIKAEAKGTAADSANITNDEEFSKLLKSIADSKKIHNEEGE